VNLERAEGILPRSEQIPGEHYQPGERIRAVILDVRKSADQARIVLSRSHPDFIRRLFELEVPEVAEGVVVIRRIAREPGQRTKVAMESLEPQVDCIGACVGVRGTRIKSIIDELNGEKIDIIPWREAPEMLIADSLRPAEIIQMTLEEGEGTRRAVVTVPEDQLALAIGRKGQNVRLAVKLTGWDIDIQPPADLERGEPEPGEPEEAESASDEQDPTVTGQPEAAASPVAPQAESGPGQSASTVGEDADARTGEQNGTPAAAGVEAPQAPEEPYGEDGERTSST